MTQERATPNNATTKPPYQKALSNSYYGLLGLHPSASVREIRQAYRELSKLYHPDTTTLPTGVATTKFQQLNEAYATLSTPERRSAYDRKIGYSSVAVVQPLPSLHRPTSRQPTYSSSAYLDPTDRPLSPGEIFALFILGLTFVGCLCLTIAIGLTRGETLLQPNLATTSPPSLQQPVAPPSDSAKSLLLQPTPAKQAPPIAADSATQTVPTPTAASPKS